MKQGGLERQIETKLKLKIGRHSTVDNDKA